MTQRPPLPSVRSDSQLPRVDTSSAEVTPRKDTRCNYQLMKRCSSEQAIDTFEKFVSSITAELNGMLQKIEEMLTCQMQSIQDKVTQMHSLGALKHG